jgi:hypothetical protein
MYCIDETLWNIKKHFKMFHALKHLQSTLQIWLKIIKFAYKFFYLTPKIPWDQKMVDC